MNKKISNHKLFSGVFLLILGSLLFSFSKINLPDVQQTNKPKFILSSRTFHPRNTSDTLNTLKEIKLFKPVRIDWLYSQSKKETDQLVQLNIPFSLTLNPQLPDSTGYTTKKYRIIDYNGTPYTASWMRNWKIKNPYWGCVNNPLFQNLFLKQGIKLASYGAYALLVDDAILNARLKGEKKVGCFCEYCEHGFKKFALTKYIEISNADIEQLKNAIKNNIEKGKPYTAEINSLIKLYEAYQQESVILFYKNWENEIRKDYSHIKFLTNNYNGNWNVVYQVFDGGIAELTQKYINNKSLDSLYDVADNLGKTQLFSIPSDNENAHFSLMEYNIKNNRETLLPWDVFLSTKPTRYYMPNNKLLDKITSLEIKYIH